MTYILIGIIVVLIVLAALENKGLMDMYEMLYAIGKNWAINLTDVGSHSMNNPLHKAIDLSKIGFEYGGPFGAVITRGSEIVGEGFNLVVAHRDPTAHAEVMAIRDACRFLKTHDLSGCELHTSCEPCPMCLGAIYWARIKKVYYAATREDAAAAGFNDDDIYIEIARPIDERRIEFTQALEATRVAARAVLEAWKTKPDRRYD